MLYSPTYVINKYKNCGYHQWIITLGRSFISVIKLNSAGNENISFSWTKKFISVLIFFLNIRNAKYQKLFLKMDECDTWNLEINILVNKNEMVSLPAEFYFNNVNKASLPILFHSVDQSKDYLYYIHS